MLRRAFLIALTALTTPAAAATFVRAAPSATPKTVVTDPRGFVESVYRAIAADPDTLPPEDMFTPATQALLDDYKRRNGLRGATSGFWTNGQDAEIAAIRVTAADVRGQPGWRLVTARFHNFGLAERAEFTFKSTPAGWLLNDISSGENSLVTSLKSGEMA